MRPAAKGIARSDAILPAALVLWFVGVRLTDPEAMTDFGLLAALPVVFFLAVALLICSTVHALFGRELSPPRLALHLGALVLMLHGSIPLIFGEPLYPWTYKHVGVVGYISRHGGVDAAVDIYHNWPSFFGLAAWFTRVAGASGPLSFAAWSPVYFNLLICLILAFVFRSFPVSARARWIALFIFVVGNWVGQDYFAPQALAFVLSMAVFGMTLAWLQTDRPMILVRAARRAASPLRRFTRARDPLESGAAELPAFTTPAGRVAAIAALFSVFAVVVTSHQLSPYMVLVGLGLLTAAGMARPRWVVAGLGALAVGYLFPRLGLLEGSHDLFSPLDSPFRKFFEDSGPSAPPAMRGRQISGLAAPALMACVGALGTLGFLRLARARRPVLVPGLLAFSPVLIAMSQGYGGEAVFRVYLFSLPWVALLGACALEPRATSRQRRVTRLWAPVSTGVVLSGGIGLLMLAVFGNAELYVARPGEVRASRDYYDRAPPHSTLTLLAPNFPIGVGERYDELGSVGTSPPVLLVDQTDFRHRVLGASDLTHIAQFVEKAGKAAEGRGGRFLALSGSQQVFAEVLGLLPSGSLENLDATLARSPDWRVFHRNPDAVIYELAARSGGAIAPAAPAMTKPATLTPARERDRAVDPAGVTVGVLGFALVGLVLRRRVVTTPVQSISTEVVPKEEPMQLPELLTHPLPTVEKGAGPLRDVSDPMIVTLRDDPEPVARNAAARFLSEVDYDSERVLSAFVMALQDPDDSVRRVAIETVLRHRSPELASRLTNLLSTANLDSVGEVLLELGEMADSALATTLIQGPSDRASAAAEVLGMTGGITRLLRIVEPAARLDAVRIAAALGTPEALTGLVATLRDPRPEIRVEAAKSLGRLGDISAHGPLQRVEGSDQVIEVRNAARAALTTLTDPPQGPPADSAVPPTGEPAETEVTTKARSNGASVVVVI